MDSFQIVNVKKDDNIKPYQQQNLQQKLPQQLPQLPSQFHQTIPDDPEYDFDDIIDGNHKYPKLPDDILNYYVNKKDVKIVKEKSRRVVDVRQVDDDGRQGIDDERQGFVDEISRGFDERQGDDDERSRGFDGRQQFDKRQQFDEIQGDDDESYNKDDLYSGTPLSKKKGFFRGKIHKLVKMYHTPNDKEIFNSYVAKLLVLNYINIKYECINRLAYAIFPIFNYFNQNNIILIDNYKKRLLMQLNNIQKLYYYDDEDNVFIVQPSLFTNYFKYILNNSKELKKDSNEILKDNIKTFNKKDIKIYNIKGFIHRQNEFISDIFYNYFIDNILSNLNHLSHTKNLKTRFNKYIRFNFSNNSKFRVEIQRNKDAIPFMKMKNSNNYFNVDQDEKSSINIIRKFINKDIDKFEIFINDIIEYMKMINDKSILGKEMDKVKFNINLLISDYRKTKDKYLQQIKK